MLRYISSADLEQQSLITLDGPLKFSVQCLTLLLIIAFSTKLANGVGGPGSSAIIANNFCAKTSTLQALFFPRSFFFEKIPLLHADG